MTEKEKSYESRNMRLTGMMFDLDGTLGDTIPLCITAFRYAHQTVTGETLSDERILALFGPTEEGMCRQVMPQNWETALEAYLEEYGREHERYAEPFDGIESALRLLDSHGVRLALVTGKGPRSARMTLDRFGLTEYFDTVEFGSPEGPVKVDRIQSVLSRWSEAPGEVVYVGDTFQDIEAAHEAGVHAVRAAWASSTSSDISDSPEPLATFHRVGDFASWLKGRVEKYQD